MTTPKATFAGLALIAALCAGFTLGLTAPAWADWDTVIRDLRLRAEQGDTDAQTDLGTMYLKGLGVPQDYAKAVQWFQKAAEQGFVQAQAVLGTMYGQGLGVPQDFVQAHKWLNLAASRLTPGKLRDGAAKSRDLIAGLMTPAQISEAQKLAREWRPK